MDTITIIDALPTHVPLIRAHSDATYHNHATRLPHAFGDENAYQHALLDAAFLPPQQDLTDFRCALFSAVTNDQLMGYMLIVWTAAHDDTPTHADIADIGVFAQYQGRSVGSALLAHAQSLMPVHNWQSLNADVWRDNTASHKIFNAASFTAERTQYRFGTAPSAQKADINSTQKPTPSRRYVLILLAFALALLIYLTS